MQVAGIICEYNPFHNGHARQFRLIREHLKADTAIVCLMSGNFVQRGECAAFSKHVRAQAAVQCGADLVLELPVTVSLSSAEGFASGAADIFTRLGGIDCLCFGSEVGSTEKLVQVAQILCGEDYQAAFHAQIGRGISYPAARQAALEALGADGSLLAKPNDILGVEYCKALSKLQSPIRPLALLREGDHHAQVADAQNPSAGAVRALLPQGDISPYVPAAAAKLYKKARYHAMRYGERAMLARLYGMNKDQWQALPFSSEGLWSAVYKAVQTESSVEAILAAAKSKRYVRTRLQRLLLCAFLGLSEQDMQAKIPYIRMLAANERGGGILKTMRENGSLAVLNTAERAEESAYAEQEARINRLYALFSAQSGPQDTVVAEKNRVYYQKK